MPAFTLDKTESVRRVADRLTDAGETIVEDAKELTARAAELLDESRLAARKTLARGVRRFEDARDEAALKVRKAPFAAVGLTFCAGLILGVAIGSLGHRR